MLDLSPENVTALGQFMLPYFTEVSLHPLDPDKATRNIYACLNEGVVFAVYDDDGEMAACMGLRDETFWFSAEPHIANQFFYVAPPHRHSRAVPLLKQAAKAYADARGLMLFVTAFNYGRARDRGLTEAVEGYVPVGYTIRVR